MTINVQQILQEEFTLLKRELIQKYDDLGMRSSGNWALSLEENVTPLSGEILGEKYSEQLEFGRKSGKAPPSEAIIQWIEEKGLMNRITKKISITSLAFLIARKIARSGWNRQDYGGVELVSQVVTPERMQKILDRVSEYSLSLVLVQIKNFIK